jgi:hypothetical protein
MESITNSKDKEEETTNPFEEIEELETVILEHQLQLEKLLIKQEKIEEEEDEEKSKEYQKKVAKAKRLLAIKQERLVLKNSMLRLNHRQSEAPDKHLSSYFDEFRPSGYLGEAKKKRVTVPSGLPKFRQGNTTLEPVEFIEYFVKLMEAHEIEEEKYPTLLALCLDSVDGQWLSDWMSTNVKSNWNALAKEFIQHFYS